MRIVITGARGTLGQEVVKLATKEGHHTIQVNRTDQEDNETKNTEMRTADVANSYEDTVKAFKGADAIIHLAAVPNPVDKEDAYTHNNNVNSAFNGFRAATELGIKRICYASSVNAIGLAYANQPLHFPYFPIDEDYPVRTNGLSKNLVVRILTTKCRQIRPTPMPLRSRKPRHKQRLL